MLRLHARNTTPTKANATLGEKSIRGQGARSSRHMPDAS